MNIDIQTVINKIKGWFSKKKNAQLETAPAVNPGRDWKFVLAFLLTGFLCSVLFTGLVYLSVKGKRSTVLNQPQASDQASPFSSGELQGLLAQYEERLKKHEALRSGPPSVVDPGQ